MIPSVPVQTITVVNDVGVKPKPLARVERAVTIQVDGELRRWYPSVPTIQFGAGGWPIYLEGSCPDECLGEHALSATPTAVVQRAQFSIAFDHEVLEMLTDPSGTNQQLEVCDPVEGYAYSYKSDGTRLSDFVLPSFWIRPHHGQLDFRGRYHHGFGH